MMHGYDKDAAVAFITRCIRKADHPELAEDIPALVPQMIDADMAYMHEAGVLDDDGYAGDAYYEDDEAIEYIVESLAAKKRARPRTGGQARRAGRRLPRCPADVFGIAGYGGVRGINKIIICETGLHLAGWQGQTRCFVHYSALSM